MLLWSLIALLTAGAVMAVLAPLGRAPRESNAGEAKRVYLQQLSELDSDRAEGRISPEEAASARAEIARRLIAADAEGAPLTTAPENPPLRRAAAVLALIGIPLLSLSLYFGLGRPELPGQPLAARLGDPSTAGDIEALVAKVEAHLAGAPEDGRGWEVIAPVYLRLGRAADAASAYRSAIRLLGANGPRQYGLGEAIVAAEGGVVTAEAREAFEGAVAADPLAPGPRFYLGLAAEQEGKAEEAARLWRKLLAEAPADAAWRPALEDALLRVTPGIGGPLAVETAAAGEVAPDEQAAMIEAMVGRLAERLERDPDDIEGWLQLIRSYAVLGRAEAAAGAARSAVAGARAPGARDRVEALLADLGLPSLAVATQ